MIALRSRPCSQAGGVVPDFEVKCVRSGDRQLGPQDRGAGVAHSEDDPAEGGLREVFYLPLHVVLLSQGQVQGRLGLQVSLGPRNNPRSGGHHDALPCGNGDSLHSPGYFCHHSPHLFTNSIHFLSFPFCSLSREKTPTSPFSLSTTAPPEPPSPPRRHPGPLSGRRGAQYAPPRDTSPHPGQDTQRRLKHLKPGVVQPGPGLSLPSENLTTVMVSISQRWQLLRTCCRLQKSGIMPQLELKGYLEGPDSCPCPAPDAEMACDTYCCIPPLHLSPARPRCTTWLLLFLPSCSCSCPVPGPDPSLLLL